MLTYKQQIWAKNAARKVLYRRKKPYTEIGIKRLTCHRKGCTNKATRQWQICSDGNTYRPICDACDIALNKLVIEFMGFDNAEQIIKQYKKSLE